MHHSSTLDGSIYLVAGAPVILYDCVSTQAAHQHHLPPTAPIYSVQAPHRTPPPVQVQVQVKATHRFWVLLTSATLA